MGQDMPTQMSDARSNAARKPNIKRTKRATTPPTILEPQLLMLQKVKKNKNKNKDKTATSREEQSRAGTMQEATKRMGPLVFLFPFFISRA